MTAVYLITGEEYLAEDAIEKVRSESGADPLSEMDFDARSDSAAISSRCFSTAAVSASRREASARSER